MGMKRVNRQGAKTHLSRYLVELARGETLLPCNRNAPVGKPRIGAAKGKFVVPDSFFEPLPDSILKAFGGG